MLGSERSQSELPAIPIIVANFGNYSFKISVRSILGSRMWSWHWIWIRMGSSNTYIINNNIIHDAVLFTQAMIKLSIYSFSLFSSASNAHVSHYSWGFSCWFFFSLSRKTWFTAHMHTHNHAPRPRFWNCLFRETY